MSIKLKLREIAEMQESLNSLVKMKMPILLAWKFQKVARQINGEFQDFNKAKESLIREMGIENKEKGVYEIPQDKKEKFRDEIDSLLSHEVAIDFEPIDIAELDGSEFSVADLANLHMFFYSK